MDKLEFTAFFEVNRTFVSRQKCFFLYFSFFKYSILVVLSLSLGAVGGWWVGDVKGTLVFRFGPRLGLKTGVSAQAEQKFDMLGYFHKAELATKCMTL